MWKSQYKPGLHCHIFCNHSGNVSSASSSSRFWSICKKLLRKWLRMTNPLKLVILRSILNFRCDHKSWRWKSLQNMTWLCMGPWQRHKKLGTGGKLKRPFPAIFDGSFRGTSIGITGKLKTRAKISPFVKKMHCVFKNHSLEHSVVS